MARRRRLPWHTRDAKVERLSQVQLFSACNKRELSRIAALVDELEVPAGKVLIRQGDPGMEAFVIVDGTAKASIRGKGSTVLRPGACFGEMALLHSARRAATVTAESDMRLLVLSSRDFSALIDQVPAVARRLMAAMAERLREAERAQPHH
jgi:cAMP-dependent protein kinase regulator